ncbi:MAG: hypothetical protein ACREWG_17115 [Gammaproteobacteria bacterium]
MHLTREEALAVLALQAQPDADRDTVQRAFERLARRYPQQQFPERFRQLLEARDLMLNADREWREQLESGTLDLSWALSYLPDDPFSRLPQPGDREALQACLRRAFRGEPLGEDVSQDALMRFMEKVLKP